MDIAAASNMNFDSSRSVVHPWSQTRGNDDKSNFIMLLNHGGSVVLVRESIALSGVFFVRLKELHEDFC